MAPPLHQYVLLMYELKGTYQADACFWLVFFSPLEEVAPILKLFYFSSLVSVVQGKIL